MSKVRKASHAGSWYSDSGLLLISIVLVHVLRELTTYQLNYWTNWRQ